MRLTALALCLTLAAGPLAAQGLFTPRVYVNNSAITQYELDQRMKFMELLGAGGNVEKQAMDALVDDRLYQIAAKAAKVKVTDADVTKGIEEFAARGNLSVDEFKSRLREGGVAEQTVRDFVRAGLMWRNTIRGKYAGRVTVSNAEVDRAMQAEAQRPAIEVALSEIILPTVEPYREQSQQIAQLIQQEVHGPELFAEAARRFSAARTRENGGAMEWMPRSRLPPMIAGAIAGLKPGQVSEPLTVPNAIAFFLYRGEREGARPDPSSLTVDWVELRLPTPDAATAAARIRAKADTCDDLYAQAGAAVNRQQGAVRSLPQDVAFELARLDPGESATVPTADGGLRFLMLCARTPHYDEPPTRDQIHARLLDQKIGGMAESWLAEMRADAIIRRP